MDNVYYVCTGYWLYDVSLFYASTGFSYAKKRLEHINLNSGKYLDPDQNIYNELQILDKQVSSLTKYVYEKQVARCTKIRMLHI
ncbi:MAG: hypothetical protein ACLRR3_02360 [Eubacterium sp.]